MAVQPGSSGFSAWVHVLVIAGRSRSPTEHQGFCAVKQSWFSSGAEVQMIYVAFGRFRPSVWNALFPNNPEESSGSVLGHLDLRLLTFRVEHQQLQLSTSGFTAHVQPLHSWPVGGSTAPAAAASLNVLRFSTNGFCCSNFFMGWLLFVITWVFHCVSCRRQDG